LRKLLRAPAFTPADFVQRALFILVLFVVAHLLGWREYTTFLTGTLGQTDVSWQWACFCGTTYLLLHFATILAVPILLIAALLLRLGSRWGQRS
jgi:hypothetical protein